MLGNVKLSIATAGAAVVTLGTIGMAPVEAAQLTKLDYSGKVSGTVSLFGDFTVDVDKSYVIDNLSGRLQDAGDSELTLDHPFGYLGDYFGSYLSNLGSIDSFSGFGSIFKGLSYSPTDLLSTFNFSYSKITDILTVKGYEFDKIKVCLSGTCNISGEGLALGSVSSPIFGKVPVKASVNFKVSQTATPLDVPEPSALLGLIGLAGFFAAKRKLQKAA
ncbi:PEP-CTERM sorting domain-containing protein [Coleofasciculus sp. FACHB-64]|uniref:PEP-CTERM sorting domain-containing protein n=1 Tax=Cyanophyceae TaxID=3028117 RepID=UPI0016886125|nr:MULTISPECIES: PEP-CTERM sorting domain-containing protein [unclassified Coleofasciculus]MBD1837772.1 PEP-CTERM sorting domain-containing protein [Coleofasciculus sp. FACHB-501]MBD2044348.1 PEP-CTERM sorting domain-containing protein [Coleofasciculus sp. FACHB-64]